MILNHCIIPTSDHEAARRFYCDLLGYEVKDDVRRDGFVWLTLVSADQPELELVLETVGGDPDRSPEDLRVLQELLAKGVLARFLFGSDDLDATFRTLRDAGAEIVQEPQDQFWGVRDMAVRDPSGNMLRISQR